MTYTLSQKELQRVAVISSCVKGDLACARAASLLHLTPRHVKRLKSRLRQGGEAALAHASRGRPSHRRLPQRVRDRILHLARTTYAGFNDHHLCEKLCEVEGFSLGRAPRETEKAWRPAPPNLDHICCFHHERSVSNDNVVQWDRRRFQIPPQPQRFSFAGAKVQLYESLEGKVSIYYGNTKLLHSSGEIHSGG
jgi:transposase